MKDLVLIQSEHRQSNNESAIRTIIQQTITTWLTRQLNTPHKGCLRRISGAGI